MNFPHDSAVKHVSGESVYIDDILVNSRLLAGRVVYSKHAHALILGIELDAAKQLNGVHAVLCYKDIPGVNQMGPVIHDEVCLAADKVECVGQAIVLIAAETEDIAIEAEKLVVINYEPLEAVLNIRTAIERDQLLGPVRTMQRGDASTALKNRNSQLKVRSKQVPRSIGISKPRPVFAFQVSIRKLRPIHLRSIHQKLRR